MSKSEQIERLRQQVADKAEQTREAGREAGEAWALQARPQDLQRLEAALRDPGYADARCHHPRGEAVVLHAMITGDGIDECADTCEADGFWQGVLGGGSDDIHDADFARSFIDGAMAVWAQVSPTRRR